MGKDGPKLFRSLEYEKHRECDTTAPLNTENQVNYCLPHSLFPSFRIVR